ncbi:metalloregulator ArsR/SmtB family transcription factor [Aestuariirhabdus sp. Z084]|uniref:ArsR/SmtB family transcription factor n=1 Tax=Aestuariirhabdus haliotis TaxID=2918751 RepID=UPI00201B44EC|nr:metalloregulator ArsR/SmtB family transcription factor [Aestuariirhabdus haliotis]MCL6415024.1 metalloregulator ArsR/SmtB family transcription factor [Aestuariirhabdus haliotis]MCL6418956.1 metalloregulator ArsR/SmtB family transcription factor [Aestuariirhabdus haliotis]
MNIDQAAKALKELGHPTRLAVYKRLAKAGSDGIAVGVVQDELGIPGSTLSHHLTSLTSAGLINQRREGRVLYCVAQYEQLSALMMFLQEECCADQLDPVPPIKANR